MVSGGGLEMDCLFVCVAVDTGGKLPSVGVPVEPPLACAGMPCCMCPCTGQVQVVRLRVREMAQEQAAGGIG